MTVLPPTDAEIVAAIRAVDELYLDDGDDAETSAYYRWSAAQHAIAQSNLLSVEAGMHRDALVYGEIDLDLFGEALKIACPLVPDQGGRPLQFVDVGSGCGRVRLLPPASSSRFRVSWSVTCLARH
jgi:hypothetical protein